MDGSDSASGTVYSFVSKWTDLNDIFDEIILSSDKAKSAGIAVSTPKLLNS